MSDLGLHVAGSRTGSPGRAPYRGAKLVLKAGAAASAPPGLGDPEISDALWPLLAPGGVMLYATCSILDEENSQVVREFLAVQGDAELSNGNREWGQAVACGRQLLPTPGGPDGLFYALLKKAG